MPIPVWNVPGLQNKHAQAPVHEIKVIRNHKRDFNSQDGLIFKMSIEVHGLKNVSSNFIRFFCPTKQTKQKHD